MRLISVNTVDGVNSITGYTLSLFFSGCSHGCEGCFSKQTWNYYNGREIDVDTLFRAIVKNKNKNVSFIGGDPLFEKNRKEVVELIKRIKKETNKTIYLWTGYTKDEVEKWIDIRLIDYLIDGKFELSKRDVRLVLRGSSNQRIYHKGIDITDKLEENNK